MSAIKWSVRRVWLMTRWERKQREEGLRPMYLALESRLDYLVEIEQKHPGCTSPLGEQELGIHPEPEPIP